MRFHTSTGAWIFSGVVTAAVIAPTAVYAAAGSTVAIGTRASSSTASVTANRHLLTTVAANAVVFGSGNNASHSCVNLHTPPAGKAMVVTGVRHDLPNNTAGNGVSVNLTDAACLKTYDLTTSSQASDAQTVTFPTGRPMPSAGFTGAVNAHVYIPGLLIPASQHPAAPAAAITLAVALTASVPATLAPASATSRPSAPRELTATSLNEAVRLNWLAPSTDGGATVTDYIVLYRRADTTIWSQFLDHVSTARSTTVTGLSNGRAYQFKVAAQNRAGQGTFSTIVTRTPSALPGPPRNLVSGFQGGGAVLEWDGPAGDPGTPVTDYRVQYKLASATTWTTYSDGVSTAKQATVPVNGDYQLRVAAINLAGVGPFATVRLLVDSDADHFSRPADCNDHDQSVHPGAVEVDADGIDNDCDGTTDDGISTADIDSDGTSVAAGDCNDHDQTVHPGAAEVLGDGIDNDCDGTSDARP